MKNSSGIISILFLIGGMGIIVASYFLFLKDCQQEKIFYLNMVVTCLVFAVLFVRAFDVFGPVGKVAESGSGYGLQWTGTWIYAPLALALVACSILFELGFNLCLIGHIVLLFVLLLFFFLGSLIRKNVNGVTDRIEARKSGLREISAQIDLLEMRSKLGRGGSYQEAIARLRENTRFITASDKPAAIALENMLVEKIRLIASQIEHNSQTPEVINAEFQECMSIIELRKNQY
jgi:hypothetical protein